MAALRESSFSDQPNCIRIIVISAAKRVGEATHRAFNEALQHRFALFDLKLLNRNGKER